MRTKAALHLKVFSVQSSKENIFADSPYIARCVKGKTFIIWTGRPLNSASPPPERSRWWPQLFASLEQWLTANQDGFNHDRHDQIQLTEWPSGHYPGQRLSCSSGTG